MGHELFDFMREVSSEVAHEYERIHRRAAEDPGTAGDEGEMVWAGVLRQWLPAAYHVTTKGRLLTADGRTSDQLDLFVLSPSCPPTLVDKGLYLASGVVAAFECRLTLRPKDIAEAVQQGAGLRALFPERKGTPYKELHSPLIYGLLAHSHGWKSGGSTPIQNVDQLLRNADTEYVGHPREMLDMVCVADLGTWTSMKVSYMGPAVVGGEWGGELARRYGSEGSATTATLGPTGQTTQPIPEPVGVLFAKLLTRMAWEDAALRPLADYWQGAGLFGQAEGFQRRWPLPAVYSDVVRASVASGLVISGDRWNEWSIGFL